MRRPQAEPRAPEEVGAGGADHAGDRGERSGTGVDPAYPVRMIAEIFPQAYDAVGRKVFRPDLRRKGVHPTFPMGRYVSQPLSVKCASLEDMRKFLCTCSGVSDEEQFGKRDYWQPPENFEQTRKGDCDDFAPLDLEAVA